MKHTNHRIEIFNEISLERERQNIKWGDQSHHSNEKWMVILIEEIGEVAKDLLDGNEVDASVELIQCAAVIVQWLEIMYARGFNTNQTP